MSRLLFGEDEKIAAWVASKIPDAGDFGPCRAIGIISDDGAKLYAGMVYHLYVPQHGTICFSLASVNPVWMTRENIRRLLAYPFRQLEVRKIMAFIASDNARSLRLARGLGFKQEAKLRHQFGTGRHAEVWSLMASEFDGRWGSDRAFDHFRRRLKVAA